MKLPELNFTEPYKAAVIIENDCSNKWRNEVSDFLVKSGCKYMCAWGVECSLWDDSVDWSCIEAFGDSNEESVVTTWHDQDTLRTALQFLKYDAEHSYVEIKKTIIFHVSKTSDQMKLTSEFENA